MERNKSDVVAQYHHDNPVCHSPVWGSQPDTLWGSVPHHPCLGSSVWQGAHHTLHSEAWVHDDPPKQDLEPPGTGAAPVHRDCSPPNTPGAALESYRQVWRGLQPEWLLILTQHAHMSTYPWCCGSSASPRLGYGMGWLFAGAVGNEDEAHTEEKYSVLKHTFVRSPIVSIVTIKVRGSIKFCMHFLH